MQWLERRSIFSRLRIGFAIVVILLLVQGISTSYQVTQIKKKIDDVTETGLPTIEQLGDVESAIFKLQISGFEFATTPEKLEQESTRLTADIKTEFEEYKKLINTQDENDKFSDFLKTWENYYQARQSAIQKRRAGGTVEEYVQALQGTIREDFSRLENSLDELVKINKNAANKSGREAEQFVIFALWSIVILLVIQVIVGFASSTIISNTITRPINKVLEMAQRLAEGDLASLHTSFEQTSGIGRRSSEAAFFLEQANRANETSSSEVNKLSFAMNNMVLYLKEMANAANTIADGNLSIQVQPKSDRDLFGNAFKKMVDNLRSTGTVADSIANGDLTVKVAPRSPQDSFGNSFKSMVDSLRSIISDLADGVQSLSSSAEELVAVSNSQSNNINEQASSTQEISTTVDEIRSIVEQTNDRAKDVVRVAEQSLDISETGQQELEQVVEAMGKIKDQVEEIAENILDLSEKTIQVGEITSSVNDIAEQSNLLAVNAAIEATKAGEAGKGFGVVAVEVKNLASRSKKATTQVRSILTEIQKSANSTVLVTEEGSKRVESGVDQVNRIGKNVKTLHEVILESSRAAKQIAASTNQQVSGIEQIVIAMKNINKITNESAAGAKQQKATAANLSQLANNLNHIVQRYRI